MTRTAARKHNSRAEPNRVVASLGDVDPEYGGTIVYRNRYGLHVTHWESDDDDDERALYTVWTTDLPDDVFAYHNWAKPAAVARTHGQDVEELLRMGRSRSPVDRAAALEMIAGHDGWNRLNDYPVRLTIGQIRQRWGNFFSRKGTKSGRAPTAARGAGGRFVKRNGWSTNSRPGDLPPAREAGPGSSLWSARFIHKISPREGDVAGPVSIPDRAWADRRALGAALRGAGILHGGVGVRSVRREGDRVVVFPTKCEWHSVVLTRR